VRPLRALPLLLLPLLLAPACAPAPPGLLLLVSDTLRGDALSCYGGRARAPHLCELAAQGVLFENAYSNGSWTLPASVSLLTGKYASVFARVGEELADKNDFFFVPGPEVLLAERLAERGYDAVAFVENALALKPRSFQGFRVHDLQDLARLRREYGGFALERGIDASDYRYLQLLPALRYLGEEAPERFFAVVWIMDPHAVYQPPRHFAATLEVDASKLPNPLDHYARLAARADERRGLLDGNALAPGLSEVELEAVRALYHKEVESVDERVGMLLDALERRGLRERTFVVFTSDHGEGFREHGKVFHADPWFYQEFVRVPLLVAGPGIPAGRRVARAVSHVDLVPTLAELLDVEGLEGLQGASLRGLLLEGVDLAPERVQYAVGSGTSRGVGTGALVDGRYKLVLRAGGSELYDLEADPGERRDLAALEPERLRALERRAAALHAENEARRLALGPLGDPEELRRARAETQEELRALGYVE
jgi:arylsulfatase A-like enzyme